MNCTLNDEQELLADTKESTNSTVKTHNASLIWIWRQPDKSHEKSAGTVLLGLVVCLLPVCIDEITSDFSADSILLRSMKSVVWRMEGRSAVLYWTSVALLLIILFYRLRDTFVSVERITALLRARIFIRRRQSNSFQLLPSIYGQCHSRVRLLLASPLTENYSSDYLWCDERWLTERQLHWHL